MCINYANERLQHYFSLDYLKRVQAEYESEGITWNTVAVNDNHSTVELLSGNPSVFSFLNEVSFLSPYLI